MTAQNIHLAITGMRCAGCVANVKKALDSVTGVELATVDLTEASAIITGKATADQLQQAVKAAGYEATVLTSQE